MTWFKVGDELTFHPRVLRAGNAAIGLWTRAGTWCSEHLTDGWIGHEDARALGTAAEIKKLVSVGLWYEEERNGERGYQFHRWATDGLGQKRQPSRAEVEADREAARERQRKHREKAESQPPVGSDSSVSHANVTRDAYRDSPISHTDPGPARPVPTTTPPAGGPPKRRPSRIPEPFVVDRPMRSWAAEEVPGLDVDGTTRQFVDYWRSASGRTAVKLDWVAAWRVWLRKEFLAGTGGKPLSKSKPVPSKADLKPFSYDSAAS